MIQAKQRDPATVLPEITLDAIAPPYPDYPYFQDWEGYPFRARATGGDMVNAWWLVEAATLAWSEEGFARERFRQAGLEQVKYFNGPSTQGYVAANTKAIIVAFRGTEIRPRPGPFNWSNIVADIMINVNIGLVESGGIGRVHGGFKQGLDEVWVGLYDHIGALRRGSGRTLWFTGHSLGAALATLAAHRYGSDCTLYTFGSPRVGDWEFKEGFPVPTFRFVNHLDMVTRVPPADPYQHVGELYYIDDQGRIHVSPAGEDTVAESDAGTGLSGFLASMWPASRSAIPQGILDHVPLLYATLIWNNIP